MKIVFLFLILLICLRIDAASPKDSHPEKKQEVVLTALYGPAELRIAAIQECSTIPYCMRALLQALKDEDAEVRYAAARSLGFLGLEETINPLKEAVQKEQVAKVKAVMVWAIGSSRPKNAKELVTVLEPLLNDANPEIRRTTAFALGALRDPETVVKLKNQAEAEKEEWVKVEIYRAALAIKLTDIDLQKSLYALLKSNDPAVRLRVANTIHDFRLRNARDELKRAIFLEEDPKVRDAMEQAYLTCLYR